MRLEIESITAAPPMAEQMAPTSHEENNTAHAQEFLKSGIRAAQAGNRADARTALLRATELDPRSENAWLWLASISEYPEELLVFLNNVLEISPENARALEWRAATNSLLARTLIQRGADAVEEGQNEKAAEYFSKSLEYDQQNAMAWMWLASLSESSEGKLNYLESALAIEPENEKALAAYRDARHDLTAKHLAEAKAAAVEGRTAEAQDLLNAVLEEMPDSEDAWMLRSHFSETFDEKIRSFERVLEINPGNAAAAASLASLRSLIGEPETPVVEEIVTESSETEAVLETEEAAAETDGALELNQADAEFVADTAMPETAEPYQAEGVEEMAVEAETPAFEPEDDPLEVTALDVEEHSTETAVEVSDETTVDLGLEARSDEEQPEAAEFQDETTQEEVQQAASLDETAETETDLGEEFEYPLTADPFAETVDETIETVFSTDDASVEEQFTNGHAEDLSTAESVVFEEVSEQVEEFTGETAFEDAVPDATASLEMFEHAVEAATDEVTMPSEGLFGFDGSQDDPYKTVFSLPSVSSIFEEANLRFDEQNGHQQTDAVDDEVPVQEALTNGFAEENKVEAADPFTAEAPYAADAIPMPEADLAAETSVPEASPDTYQTNVVTQPQATACAFCGHANDAFAVSCGSCMAVLTLSDIEMLLANTNADRVVIRSAVEAMEDIRSKEGLSENEMTMLGIGHLNLNNLETAHSVLAEASRLNPNNVFLTGQVNALHIRINEILAQQKTHEQLVSGKKILVVDDSPTIRKLISGKLEKCGHDVVCSSDGVEAMEMLQGMKPDLILLDITMPRMDGYQVCKMIRGNDVTKDVPVVMISGKDGFFDKVRGRMAGSSGYITKPFGPETLMKVVDGFLKNGNSAMAEV